MKIIASGFRPFSKNTLKGFVTLDLPDAGIRLKECTWHEKEGKEWVGFPGRQFTGKDGQSHWQNLIEFLDGFDRNTFQKHAIAAIYAATQAPPSEQQGYSRAG